LGHQVKDFYILYYIVIRNRKST